MHPTWSEYDSHPDVYGGLAGRLFINAWDPHSLVGNANFTDASMDGYYGRSTAMALLCWPPTNPSMVTRLLDADALLAARPLPPTDPARCTAIHLREGEPLRYIHIASPPTSVTADQATPPAEPLVHVLMPLVGGSLIGIDNTCQSVIEMQTFFARAHHADEQRVSAAHMLARYSELLTHDQMMLRTLRPLFTLDDTEIDALLALKQRRGEQASTFARLLQRMSADAELNVLRGTFPAHPPTVRTLLQGGDFANLGAMLLCPHFVDHYTRFDHFARFRLQRQGTPSEFAGRLRRAVQMRAAQATGGGAANERLEALVAQRFGSGSSFDYESLRSAVADDVNHLFGLDVRASLVDNPSTTRDNVAAIMAFEGNESPSEYVTPLLQLADIDLSMYTTSVLQTATAAELGIVLQLFCGLVALYAHALYVPNDGADAADVGAAMERESASSDDFTSALVAATTSPNAEAAVIELLIAQCGVPSSVRTDAARLAEILNECWATIKDAPHYDEFVLVFAARGGAAVFQNCISIDLAHLATAKPVWAGDDAAFFAANHDAFCELQASAADAGDVTLSPSNLDAVGGPLTLRWDALSRLPRDDESTKTALATLLLCKADGEATPLFATISDVVFEDLVDVLGRLDTPGIPPAGAGAAGGRADTVLEIMLTQMADQPTLDAFKRRFVAPNRDFKRLTRADARSIYHAATNGGVRNDLLAGLDNHDAPHKMRRALELVANVRAWGDDAIVSIHMSDTLSGYTIECTPTARQGLDELCSRPITFHFTPTMARSVYLTAIEHRGNVYAGPRRARTLCPPIR